DDVVYIISSINYTNKDNLGSYSVNDSRNNNIKRITLYGEIEEGKEGDMSDIAVDTNDNINTLPPLSRAHLVRT
ncbi:MAG TPA: hypothetical protein VFY68_09770, partial [Nitrososphaeraceae archaeon]|nr:hypothetical protein [Nitrososphaeraceae archaeon]